jgi:hypothetical protein
MHCNGRNVLPCTCHPSECAISNTIIETRDRCMHGPWRMHNITATRLSDSLSCPPRALANLYVLPLCWLADVRTDVLSNCTKVLTNSPTHSHPRTHTTCINQEARPTCTPHHITTMLGVTAMWASAMAMASETEHVAAPPAPPAPLPVQEFGFGFAFGDDMVLQQAPSKAAVYGFLSHGATGVKVSMSCSHVQCLVRRAFVLYVGHVTCVHECSCVQEKPVLLSRAVSDIAWRAFARHVCQRCVYECAQYSCLTCVRT